MIAIILYCYLNIRLVVLFLNHMTTIYYNYNNSLLVLFITHRHPL